MGGEGRRCKGSSESTKGSVAVKSTECLPHSPAPVSQLNPATVQILHSLGPAVVLITHLVASES